MAVAIVAVSMISVGVVVVVVAAGFPFLGRLGHRIGSTTPPYYPSLLPLLTSESL